MRAQALRDREWKEERKCSLEMILVNTRAVTSDRDTILSYRAAQDSMACLLHMTTFISVFKQRVLLCVALLGVFEVNSLCQLGQCTPPQNQEWHRV